MQPEYDVHDQGLYSTMLRSLAAFSDGSKSLRQLIDALRASRAQLHAADQAWADEFENLTSDLDVVFNDCVEAQEPPTPQQFGLIVETVAQLKTLISGQRRWSEEQIDILRQIVWDRRPELLDDLDDSLESGFSPQMANAIRSVVFEELDEKGKVDGTVNEWGQICEDLVSRIVPASP